MGLLPIRMGIVPVLKFGEIRTFRYNTVLYCTVQCITVLYYTVLYYTVLRRVMFTSPGTWRYYPAILPVSKMIRAFLMMGFEARNQDIFHTITRSEDAPGRQLLCFILDSSRARKTQDEAQQLFRVSSSSNVTGIQ